MKNIQVIDDALNTVYDIFELDDDDFALIFPGDTNIAFIDEVDQIKPKKKIFSILQHLWKHPVRKCEAMGIHGILFFGLNGKKQFYPTRRDEEAQWPGGGLVRNAENDRFLRSKVRSD